MKKLSETSKSVLINESEHACSSFEPKTNRQANRTDVMKLNHVEVIS